MRNDGSSLQNTAITITPASFQNIGQQNHADNNVLPKVDKLKVPIDHNHFFDFTDPRYQGGNELLFLLYGGSVYSVSLFNAAPLMVLNLCSFGWNYIELITRIIAHIYNIIMAACGHKDQKKSFITEVLDIFATLVLGAGTVLSTLATFKVLTGILAIACAPLANLTAAFCSIMMSVIDLVKCYKAYQKTKLPVMLQERLKQFVHIDQALNRNEEKIRLYRKSSENERETMLQQSIALMRVAIADGTLTQKAINDLLENQGLAQDTRFNTINLQQPPSDAERAIVKLMRNRYREIFRTHAFGAGFWFLVGTSVCLATLTTAFFPVLLIPAIAVIAVTLAVKGIELLELDKHIYNGFVSKANQKAITYDNAFTNFLARHYQEKQIFKDYYNDTKKLSIVHEVVRQSRLKLMLTKNRIKMRIVYESSVPANHRNQDIEKKCYKELLKLPWKQLRDILNHAIDTQLEKKVMTTSEKVTNYKKSLTIEDRKYHVKKWCRENYRLFSTTKTKHQTQPSVTGQMPTNCHVNF